MLVNNYFNLINTFDQCLFHQLQPIHALAMRVVTPQPEYNDVRGVKTDSAT